MRWSKYTQIALSIDRLLLASESDAKLIHGQVSFVEVRHGLDKRNFLFPKMSEHYIVQGLYVDFREECMLCAWGM